MYIRGVCRISRGGGGTQLEFFWDFGYTYRETVCREQRSCEPLLGGFGGMPPKIFFKKWCNFVCFESYFQQILLSKSSQKIINKQDFFSDPFIMLLSPLIYLNIDVMDTQYLTRVPMYCISGYVFHIVTDSSLKS